MRVVSQITAGYEELQQELKRFPAKQRAERFRLLASIGLLVIQGRHSLLLTASAAEQGRERSTESQQPPADPRRNQLKGKLRQSLAKD